MQVQALITALDEEIARLRQARELLGGAGEVKRRGRPKGSTNKPAAKGKTARASVSASSTKPKRQMSPEGKARIAAAQKARWAAQKGTSATAAKKTRGPVAGATRTKPPAALDRRTRAGKAAAKAASPNSKGKASKRAASSKAAVAPIPAAAPEVMAQA